MKDVGAAEKRFLRRTTGRDGITHTRTDEGHFYSPPPPTLGDNKRYQVSPVMNIEGMVGTESKSAWAVTPTKIVKQNSKSICTFSYHRKEVYKIFNESDERCRRS